jgi:hypothetical protein
MFVLTLTLLCALPAHAQGLDDYGNRMAPGGPYVIDSPLGTVLTSFKAPPVTRVAGITMVGDSLWVLSYPGVLSNHQLIFEMDPNTGAVKSSVSVATTTYYGLGFDLRRNEFVMCTPSTASLARVSLSGTVTTTWSAPSSRPIGVAYDLGRDAYWVPDWSNNNIYLVNARDGSLMRSFNVGGQGLTRLAGCGYSEVNDLIYTSGRNENQGGMIDPTTGKIVYTVNHPGGSNVGQGATVYRRTQAPISGNWNNGTNQTIYAYEMGLPRVFSPTSVKVGVVLPIRWIATREANRVYLAAASFSESGFLLGNRLLPISLDALFFLSIQLPPVFNRFSGTLDGNGEATGAVVVPNAPALAGISFSLAFITVDNAAPYGISAISGPQRVRIVP